MFITKCTNKDSYNRNCNQHKAEDVSIFCGIDQGDLTCAKLATQYLKPPYNEGVSNETKVWLSRHNQELLRQLQTDKKLS